MKQKRLILFALLFLCLGLLGTQAQQSINSSGGNASGNGGSQSYSIGQVSFRTFLNATGMISEGVQHAYEIWESTGIEEATGVNLLVTAYPNPTKDYLTLSIEDFDLTDLWYQVFDMSGRILQSQKITNTQTDIDMNNLLPTTYFIRVIRENHEIKTFKVIKN